MRQSVEERWKEKVMKMKMKIGIIKKKVDS